MSTAVRAFDLLAVQYDAICEGDLLSGMRRQAHRRLASLFPDGARVIEVGCGTGRDTAFLSSRGVTVIAADPSAGMVERARARLSDAATPAIVMQCGLEDLDNQLPPPGPGRDRFDGIVSNFGALNCVPRLDALGQLALRHLAPGGRLAIAVMTPFCLWESVYFLLRGRTDLALRRRGGRPVDVQIEGIPVPTYYYTPGQVMAALGAGFRLERVEGLGVVVPPPYLEPRWQALPPFVRRAGWILDALLGAWFPFNRLGDHVWLEIVRR